MIPESSIELIAQDPKNYLMQCYRLDARIRVKNERIQRLYQVSTQITSAAKTVSAYTGPSDKIGNCVLEIISLQEDIAADAEDLLKTQREAAAAILELVPNLTQRAILEARYLTGMSWEQISYEFHYAYRWTLRLHKRGLAAMRAEAERRKAKWAETVQT